MRESEVLKQILTDYIAQNPDADKNPLDSFCAYAGDWLSTHNIVGLGMTASGMALRFGDGREMTFFVSSDMPTTAVTPPISVTGNNGGRVGDLVNASAVDTTSVQIKR